MNNLNLQENHNLYVLRAYNKHGESIIKFGFSKSLKTRLNSYFSMNPYTEVIFTCFQSYGIEYEKLVHSIIESNYKNEWYPEDKLNELINYIFSDDYKCYNNFTLPVINKSKSNFIITELDIRHKIKFEKECNKSYDIIISAISILDSFINYPNNIEITDYTFNNLIFFNGLNLTKFIHTYPDTLDLDKVYKYKELTELILPDCSFRNNEKVVKIISEFK